MTSHAPGIDAQWAAIFGPLELLVRLVDGALHGHLLKLFAPNVLQRDSEGHRLFCEPQNKPQCHQGQAKSHTQHV